ncbi:MAG: DUF3098 domain-containing protein [Bacteroidia bacterium]|nr:DUF3098 domain-containing protein [Bacteroidia bacterium]
MKAQDKKIERNPEISSMPFERGNYRWLLVGSLLLLIGYALLMQPDTFVDSREFSLALYVAPWVILGGFGTLIYAILKR